MSIEEKAKAYDEALKKAKKYHEEYWQVDAKDVTETLFPELRESEDETTRKELLDFMRSFWADHKETLPQAGRWVTYLEKQKEHNRKDEEYTDFTIYHPLKNGKGKYECIPYSFYGSLTSFSEDKDLIDFLRTCFYTKEECNEWIEQQKEQNEITIEQVYKEFINPEKLKDAKTNKYIRAQLLWELMHNGIITEVDYQYLIDDKRKPWTAEEYRVAYQKGFEMSEQLKQKEQKPAEWSEDDKKMIETICKEGYLKPSEQCWLKSLPERFNLQLKNEWSEEDKKTVDAAIYWLKKVLSLKEVDDILTDDCPISIRKTVDKLKSLHLQPKQKLSKKDKKILLSLHHVMNCADAQNAVKRDGLGVEDVCNFLFSIEPHWKPEGQQLDCLRHMINVSTVGGIDKQLVQDLYEQLKKLM